MINDFDKNLLSISKDGDKFCILWGENLQVGIAGFGSTYGTAWVDFITNISDKWLETAELKDVVHNLKIILRPYDKS
jgi:hypothetical protein